MKIICNRHAEFVIPLSISRQKNFFPVIKQDIFMQFPPDIVRKILRIDRVRGKINFLMF